MQPRDSWQVTMATPPSKKNRCLSVTAAHLACELLSAGRMEILQLSYGNKCLKPMLVKVIRHYTNDVSLYQ